jgi:hypothetical protein
MGLFIASGFTTAIALSHGSKLGRLAAGLLKLELLISAGLTIAVVLGAVICLLFRAENSRPGAAVLAFAITLAMSLLAYYLVASLVGAPIEAVAWSLIKNFERAPLVLVLPMFCAPLTEEPVKWLAAAVPMVCRAIRLQPVTMALVVGLGFSIGETWFLAHVNLFQPGYGYIGHVIFPPHDYVGDIIYHGNRGYPRLSPGTLLVIEQLEVSFLHGAFVALPFVAFARGSSFFLGGLAGMALHFFLDFPILLVRFDVFGLGSAWALVWVLWLTGFAAACALTLWWLARRPLPAAAKT